MVGDSKLLGMIEELHGEIAPEKLDVIVRRAGRVKIRVVEEDPFERRGPREALNFGHTIGHAVEAWSNYKIPHGDAVSIGMTAESKLVGKNRRGRARPIRKTFNAVDRPRITRALRGACEDAARTHGGRQETARRTDQMGAAHRGGKSSRRTGSSGGRRSAGAEVDRMQGLKSIPVPGMANSTSGGRFPEREAEEPR